MKVLRRFVALCLLLVSASAAPGETPRPESMADTLRIMAEAFAPFGAVRLDEAAGLVEVTLPGGQLRRASPDNLHIQLQKAESAAARDKILSRFVSASFAEHVAARENIVSIVRHRDYAASVPASWPMLQLAGDLVSFIAINGVGSLALGSDQTLEQLGLSEDEAFALAAQNLAKMAKAARFEGDDILVVMMPDGHFASSMMLVPAFWSPLQKRYGSIVAAPVARDQLVVIDGARKELVTALRQYVRNTYDQLEYPLSRNLFVLGPEGWTVLN